MNESGERLKELREKAGYTLRDLATITGISKATLSRYENKGLDNIPLDKLEMLAKSLNTSQEYLLNVEQKIQLKNIDSKNFKKIFYNSYSRHEKIDELSEFRKELERANLFDAINYKLKLLNMNALEQILNYTNFLSTQDNMLYSQDYLSLKISLSAQKIINYVKTAFPEISDEEIMDIIEKQFKEYKKEKLNSNAHNSHSDEE